MPADPLQGRMQQGRKMHKQPSPSQRPSNAVHLPSLAQQPRQLGFQKALLGGVVEGLTTEDEIAEAIFDWWISGKSYMQWYVQRYLQGSFNFDSDDPPQQSTQEEEPAT